MVWKPDSIQFFIDNALMGTVNADKGFWARGNFGGSGLPNPWTRGTIMAPFDQEFHLIINNAGKLIEIFLQTIRLNFCLFHSWGN